MKKIKITKKNQFFGYNQELIKLENDNKSIESIEYLNNQLDDTDSVILLIGQCSYLLSNWQMNNFCSMDDYKKVNNTLLNIVNNSYEQYKNNSKYCFILGYFMSQFPYLFTPKSDEISNKEELGKKLLMNAYLLEKDNLLYEYFYLGTKTMDKKYIKCKEKLMKQVNDYFPKQIELEKYFNEMICIKIN